MARTSHPRFPRRRFLLGGGSLLAVTLLGACGGSGGSATNTPARSPSVPPTDTPTLRATPSPKDAPTPVPTPPKPSLEEMAGQVLMLGFRGTSLSAGNPIIANIRDRHLGGVILFSYDLPSDSPIRNIESPEQVRALCTALQEAGDGRLLIAVDEEGGKVARLGPDHGFPATRSAAELGATGDPAVTRAASEAIAGTLASLGFNLNFAPVVDVNTNPQNPVIGQLDRSFSSDPQVVAAHAAAFVEGHRAHGIVTSLKHFPGHGSSRADSHAGFVDVTSTWNPLELIPYRELAGERLIDTVMVAHVFNANWDPEHPASLSPNVIQGMLRDDIGFAGPVISDDMGMGAITEKYDLEESIRLALLAGNDLLVFGNNIGAFDPDLGHRAHQAIVDLVTRGDLPEERLAKSYQRLVALKSTLPAP